MHSVQEWPYSVLLCSKLNRTFLGYYDPDLFFRKWEKIYIRGDLTVVLAIKKTTGHQACACYRTGHFGRTVIRTVRQVRWCGKDYVTQVHIGRGRMQQETLKPALNLADSLTTWLLTIKNSYRKYSRKFSSIPSACRKLSQAQYPEHATAVLPLRLSSAMYCIIFLVHISCHDSSHVADDIASEARTVTRKQAVTDSPRHAYRSVPENIK